MIRVLHMIGSLEMGGSQAMVMNLYRNINRDKIQFDFIIDSTIHMNYEEEIKALGGKIYVMEKFAGSNTRRIIKSWNVFFESHPEYKILHSHVRSYASIYLPIAKKHGLKTIIHSHSTSNGSGIKSIVKQMLQYPLRYQADCFFGCSKESGEWLFGKKIVKSDKYYILQNAINLRLYDVDTLEKQKYCEELNLIQKTVYIHVGRFHEAKNHLFLLSVFYEISKIQKDAVLLLVGDGDLRNEIENKIQELGLKDAIRLLGNRNDVPKLLSVADCFLFPSKWEGVPVSVVEAQAAGLPCLVSNTVTQEVAVSELVSYLPIDEGVECWRVAVARMAFEKQDVQEQIKKAGFDIGVTAAWLGEFYKQLQEEKK